MCLFHFLLIKNERWGFLPADTPWSLVSPKMFGSEINNGYNLEFKNCILDKEIKIN
jgi:hypothetical protein